MKFRSCISGLVRSLLAVSVSLAVVFSSHTFGFASFNSANRQSRVAPFQADEGLLSASAEVSNGGVRLEWYSDLHPDNLGFNVYRQQGGKRTRINRQIIPGAVFSFSPNDPQSLLSRGGHSYAWFDPSGTRDSLYYIESVSLLGVSRLHEALTPVAESQASGPKKLHAINGVLTQTSEIASANESEGNSSYQVSNPAVLALPHMSASTIEDQWSIAAQPGLKIAIKKDGWYRVTQPQMAAAGFNPSVDITNLQLFVDSQEVAISTSQSGGLFGPADYIEFFGRGLDVPTSDVRTYYLVAGTSAGKRVRGELQIDSEPSPTPQPSPAPASSPAPKPTWSGWVLRKLVISKGYPIGMPVIPLIVWPGETTSTSPAHPPGSSPHDVTRPAVPEIVATPAEKLRTEKPKIPESPAAPALAPEAKLAGEPNVNRASSLPALQAGGERKNSRKNRKKRRARQEKAKPGREYGHAVAVAALAPSNYDYTIERKDRGVYFSSLLNGDEENWFGQVIGGAPVAVALNVPNPDLGAVGPARLEFALQGVANQAGSNHIINVTFNGAPIAALDFGALAHPVQVVSIPLSQLQTGTNTITFTCTNSTVSIVDYVRLTYPHKFIADSGSLKFNLRGSQARTVDGFSTPLVRLIDYTDTSAITVTKPVAEPSALGYAITVPVSESRSKGQRSLYAIPQGQFDQPAALSFNQPSSLNLNSNAGDFLIVSHKNFIPSFTANVSPLNTSLVAQRTGQGRVVKVVDVEDVYDEFGYGLHGPQAIKTFLQHAATTWATKPRYVIFAGDASLDPRNYSGAGNFDLVPSKLIDATYNETVSDDWLADFDDDGIADIPVGRLPVRTATEADLVISKIVNYLPVNVPQDALLIADNPGTPPVWDFEESNDNVQALLPGSMAVQRINIRTEASNAQATANIVASLNQGKAVVNYSGHGNVNVWTGANIFMNADATGLTNGNKLSFVVVMDCLNGYYHDPNLLSLSEAFLKAPNGGAVAAFASSGLTTTYGQRQMELELYEQLYGGAPIALGDAIKIAKGASIDIDVRRTWIFFGDPSMKIR